jgi:leukotriene-A4 hydrolase
MQDWTVDFEEQTIGGSVTHTIRLLDDNVNTVTFDSAKLSITSCKVNSKVAEFTVAEAVPTLGSAVTVMLPESMQRNKGSEFTISFEYSASADASACQWLPACSTNSKKHPFLFTQCQAIHARSLLPCFDSPGIKATYSATVRAPAWATGSYNSVTIRPLNVHYVFYSSYECFV